MKKIFEVLTIIGILVLSLFSFLNATVVSQLLIKHTPFVEFAFFYLFAFTSISFILIRLAIMLAIDKLERVED
jgi:hypothetical protein